MAEKLDGTYGWKIDRAQTEKKMERIEAENPGNIGWKDGEKSSLKEGKNIGGKDEKKHTKK